jgi:hypothetical protein
VPNAASCASRSASQVEISDTRLVPRNRAASVRSTVSRLGSSVRRLGVPVDGGAPLHLLDDLGAHGLRGQQMQQYRVGGIVGFELLFRAAVASVQQCNECGEADAVVWTIEQFHGDLDAAWAMHACECGDINERGRSAGWVAGLSGLPCLRGRLPPDCWSTASNISWHAAQHWPARSDEASLSKAIEVVLEHCTNDRISSAMLYILPGKPNLPPPANAYRQPGATVEPPPTVPPASVAPTPSIPGSDPRHAVLLEWHARHGSGWVRADGLHQQVRRLLDPGERTAAIRQRVQQLVGTEVGGLRVEARAVGNPIRHRLYRVVDRP